MLALTGAVRIFLYRHGADMRKGADGLSGLVMGEMHADPLSGDVFVFCNRRPTMLKLLYWDRDGYAVWMKRLERGRYRLPDAFEPSQCNHALKHYRKRRPVDLSACPIER